jgi:DNA repair exonuclease SbcCD ATPase subunit
MIQNAQQNQLQGVQALMDDIRQEYEEFITITKIENESCQERRKAEYNALKKEYDDHKSHSFEEKKRTMMEYQNILSSMQSQYDEYRTTTEILFNMEMVKLDEEIGSQATRYEQESMYIIQAKDKFYMDMMVTKDSKIMGLIEGSDLQSLMQKHELDMENIRKEHSKDIERVKSEHESESKNVMLLLQRQNVSLESKTEKLQSHLKSIESRMKELMNTIDMKNKQILEKDDVKTKLMIDHQIQIEEYNNKLTTVMTEKERLRHKVIRLTLNAKGEGENSIESMLKRLSNDTTVLRTDYESMEGRYSQTLGENQEMLKKLREKEKMIQYFKSEVTRRSQEYKEMTNTFEDFLSARAKQNRKDKSKKLAAIGIKLLNSQN